MHPVLNCRSLLEPICPPVFKFLVKPCLLGVNNSNSTSMKSLVFFSILLSSSAYSQSCGCDHTISNSDYDVNGNTMSISPGDVICIESGIRARIKFRNFSGTAAQPVKVINCGGLVNIEPTSFSYGIKIENVDYVHFSGTGDSLIANGFKIHDPTGYGIDMGKLSNHFEIDHFEFEETGNYAIYYKNEPVCDSSANEGVFFLEDAYFHDLKITNCHKGIRVGHPDFGIGVTGTSCDTLWPHSIENIRLAQIEFDLITGGDAIRLYGTEGEISDNSLSNVSGRGITLGTQCEVSIERNKIFLTEDEGLRALGSGRYSIQNNIFYSNGDATHEAVELAFEDPNTSVLGNQVDFINNTIVNSAQHALSFINPTNITDTCNIRNNVFVNSGATPNSNPYSPDINITDTTDYLLGTNFFTDSVELLKFKDQFGLDFQLTHESPLIDAGENETSSFDAAQEERNLSLNVDIGAYEYVPERIAYFEQIQLQGLYVNDFKFILGDSNAETALLEYAQDSGFNYLLFYNLTYINNNMYDITDPAEAIVFADFIETAKRDYGIVQIGVVGETNGSFNKVEDFNNLYNSNWYQTVDVLNLEFEFWANTSGSAFTYYCSNYLSPNSLPCTNAGAFTFSSAEMDEIDQRAHSMGCISEIYLGSPTNQQMLDISEETDRVLLHCYRSSDTYNNGNSIYNYKTYRLEELAQSNRMPAVMPIFSSRDNHMGPWLQSHSILQPMDTWLNGQNSYDDDTSAVQNIQISGFQWYRYTNMNGALNKSTEQGEVHKEDQNEDSQIDKMALASDIIVYPVPSRNKVIIDFVNTEEAEVLLQVYSISGQLTFSQRTNGTRFQIEKNDLESGPYMFSLQNGASLRQGQFQFVD